ncbi:MAG: hypothetical protein KAS72_09850 [Phycisphaerales bacterium]|nr:hypothetical protein [Phycisphaerales bacterium]
MRTFRRFRSMGAVAGSVLVLLAWAMPTAWGDDVELDRLQRQRAKEATAAAQLVGRLDLTRRQARMLIPILEQAAEVRIRVYEAEAALLPEIVEAYSAFLEEDRLDCGFTPEIERRTAGVHHREIVMQDAFAEQLIALEEQASKILTTRQRTFVESLRHDGQPFAQPRDGRTNRQHDPLHEKRSEMREIQSQKHPRPGMLGRLLLHPAAYADICAIVRTTPTDPLRRATSLYEEGSDTCSPDELAAMRAEARRLHAEINNWNLINGLQFTEQQISHIVEAYDAAVWLAVMEQGDVDPARPIAGRRLVELEQAINAVLTDGQLAIMAEYKPCLLPPKDLKDPVRAGQASDSSHYERLLARTRNVPDERLSEVIERLLKAETRYFGELSKDERWRRARLVRATIQQAAAMTDTEFELNKADLAERIARDDKALELRGEIDQMSRDRGRPGLVSAFLINDGFMSQLKVRADQLAEGVMTVRVDLEDGPQAENCEDGCAVD